MRYFGGKAIELLAPAGNESILEGIVRTKCDAVYFGGQSLNMRMIRKGYNFSDEALARAVKLCHQHDKKAYITVNNLIDEGEIGEARRFLSYLNDIRPDGLIVQDMAILKLIQEMNLDLEIHASVMMNVHSVPMIEALKKEGLTRIVASREMPLAEVARIKSEVDIEVEYFTHGDMCIAHGAQCYYSSLLFGMSSNRGKCLKPCRWWFEGEKGNPTYPMAVKDMCMYPYLPEMIEAGVTSFKIEGRMREKDFICNLINVYGEALDRYIEDPVGYDRYKDYQQIVEHRKRDLSVAYAFGKPGVSNINVRNEGTGKIFSTGKMFSTPTQEPPMDDRALKAIEALTHERPVVTKERKLSIKVNHPEVAGAILEEGYDRIYISGDTFKIHDPLSIASLRQLKKAVTACEGQAPEIYLGLPRMMTRLDYEKYNQWLPKVKEDIDGLLVGNLGSLEAYQSLGLPVVGDYGINLYNHKAWDFYKARGLSQQTASIELKGQALLDLLDQANTVEVVAYGRVPVMFFEHDFQGEETSPVTMLRNEAGVFEIYKDYNERSSLMSRQYLSYLPIVKYLNASMLRYEAQTDSVETIKATTQKIKAALKGQVTMASNETLGALTFTE